MVQGVKAAGAERGRQLGVYAQFVLIIGESDAQARRIAEDIVAGADIEAIANVFSSAGLDTNAGGSAEHLRTGLSRPLEEGNIAFMGSPVIYGSAQTVASKIEDIAAETGIEGMLFSWPDFLPGIRAFGEKVMPKLRLQLD
jgi:pyrimidine oxygenase